MAKKSTGRPAGRPKGSTNKKTHRKPRATTGTGGSKSIIEQLTRRQTVRRLLIQGTPKAAIYKALGCDRGTIKRDIQSIYEDFHERAAIEWSEHVAEQLARIDILEERMWEAWERSIGPEEITEKRYQVEMGGSEDAGMQEVVDIKKKIRNNIGDPRYANVILSCIKERSELLGLNKQQNEDKAIDDIPIIYAVVNSREDIDGMVEAQKFLAVNKVVDGKVNKISSESEN